mmetsp:Transcript_70464/g.187312  ORF Transcript_70464/g.187312 Transcript_70464/m.187312 type:complete len:223 (-) Transcript_70464:218-886(-)
MLSVRPEEEPLDERRRLPAPSPPWRTVVLPCRARLPSFGRGSGDRVLFNGLPQGLGCQRLLTLGPPLILEIFVAFLPLAACSCTMSFLHELGKVFQLVLQGFIRLGLPKYAQVVGVRDRVGHAHRGRRRVEAQLLDLDEASCAAHWVLLPDRLLQCHLGLHPLGLVNVIGTLPLRRPVGHAWCPDARDGRPVVAAILENGGDCQFTSCAEMAQVVHDGDLDA